MAGACRPPAPCTARTSPSRPPTTLCPRSDSDDTSYLSERKHHTDETDDRPEVDPLDHREERTQPLAAHGAGQATFGASTFSSNSRSAQFRSNSTIHFGISEDTETCSVSSLSLNTDFRFNTGRRTRTRMPNHTGGRRQGIRNGQGGRRHRIQVKRSPRTFFLKKIRNSVNSWNISKTTPRIDNKTLFPRDEYSIKPSDAAPDVPAAVRAAPSRGVVPPPPTPCDAQCAVPAKHRPFALDSSKHPRPPL